MIIDYDPSSIDITTLKDEDKPAVAMALLEWQLFLASQGSKSARLDIQNAMLGVALDRKRELP